VKLRKVVVLQVDEELHAGRVWVLSAGHGDRAAAVLPGRWSASFCKAGVISFFFFHGLIEAAALDHEAFDHAVEDGRLVKAMLGVVEEHLNGLRRLVRK
jgi:hypothetical protein